MSWKRLLGFLFSGDTCWTRQLKNVNWKPGVKEKIEIGKKDIIKNERKKERNIQTKRGEREKKNVKKEKKKRI